MVASVTIRPPLSLREAAPPRPASHALSGLHPKMPRPGFGIRVWQQSDGETALSLCLADGTCALVGSDTDDVIVWAPYGDRWYFVDMPNSAIEFRSVWNACEHAEAAIRMARRTLADWRCVLKGGAVWLRDPPRARRG